MMVMSSDQIFEQIKRGDRLSDKVARALTASITSGAMAVGDKLPSERQLCEQFGVSRPVIREAVRDLVANGLLVDHPRRGYVVGEIAASSVGRSLVLFVRGRRGDYPHLLEVRSVLEVAAAGHAAEDPTDEQIEALRLAHERMTSDLGAEDAAIQDVAFHRAIAEATGNDYYVVLIDALRDVLLAAQQPTLADPRIMKTARAAHRKIFEAIRDRDPQAARDAMQAHLDLAGRQVMKLLAP
jgi:GntR family transcriptional regulator, transcriptional repressor for pyruvate dehydrogenase complex